MKALVICYRWPPEVGAASSRASSIAEALRRDGYDVATPRFWSPNIPYKGYLNRLLVYLGFVLSYSARLFRERHDYDVVCYVSPWSLTPLSLPASIFGRLIGAKVLLDVHDLWPEVLTENRLLLLIVGGLARLSAWPAHKITVTFSSLSEGRPWASKATVGTLAVDTEFYSPAAARFHPGLIQVGYFGTFSKRYDFEAMRLAALALSDQKQIVFMMRGTGEAGLPSQLDSNLIAENGAVSESLHLMDLQQSDILICPTRASREADTTLPLKLIEYLAVGSAIICSENRDTETLDGCVLKVPMGDHKVFTEAIMKFASDRILREEMGEKARALAVQNFSISVLSRQLEAAIA